MFKGVVTQSTFLTPRKLKSYKFTIPTLSDIQSMDSTASLKPGSVLGAYEISILGNRSEDGTVIYTDVISTLTGLRDYWAAGNTSITVSVPTTTESYINFALLVTKSCKHTAIIGITEMPGRRFISKGLELTFLDDSTLNLGSFSWSEQFTDTSNANYDLYTGTTDPCPNNSCTVISSAVDYTTPTTPAPTTPAPTTPAPTTPAPTTPAPTTPAPTTPAPTTPAPTTPAPTTPAPTTPAPTTPAPTTSGSTPTRYTYGIPSGDKYNFLVNHGSYETGVSVRNDVTSTSTNKKGIRVNHTTTDNANIDLRSSTGAVNSFSFRLQDDTSPLSFSNMLTLTDDNKSSASAYGAKVGGRMKASQYFIGESDTRTPSTTGLYIGQDANTIGYFNMNAGASGTGGFKFSTFNSDGTTSTTNINIQKSGNIIIPIYSATANALDSELKAIATFDSNGQLVRDYGQNTRLRSSEARVQALEASNSTEIPNKVNEILGRINAIKLFSGNIEPLVIGAMPTGYTP